MLALARAVGVETGEGGGVRRCRLPGPLALPAQAPGRSPPAGRRANRTPTMRRAWRLLASWSWVLKLIGAALALAAVLVRPGIPAGT